MKCASLTKSSGRIFIGLYHKYGRMPFLNYFNEMKENGADEEVLFENYRELHKKYVDDVQVRSWFLDQVLHPYESQHTLQEMVPILREADVKLIGTSINNFDPIDDLEKLYALEKKLYNRGMQYLKAKKYYPGFFCILGQKN